MSLISKILSIFRSDNADFQSVTPEIKALMDFRKELMSFQDTDRYLARSDYAFLQDKYSGTYTFFENTKRANMLKYYCKKNALKKSYVDRFLLEYEDVCSKEESSIIAKHNEQYVQRHLKEDEDYLDNILLPVDPKIILDEEQRRVVLSDEDYTLVIAGAGAGKTTTVAAKVRYLVESRLAVVHVGNNGNVPDILFLHILISCFFFLVFKKSAQKYSFFLKTRAYLFKL